MSGSRLFELFGDLADWLSRQAFPLVIDYAEPLLQSSRV